MVETLLIDSRFNGPPSSGHGGYSCGVVARRLEAQTAEVTLRTPPPLDTALEIVAEDGGLRLLDGETLVAEARATEPFELRVPEPVTPAEAEAARSASGLHEYSPFPTCFVCGPARAAGDGLRVIAGPVEGRDDVIASPWEVDDAFPLEGEGIAAELVWAALDCPGGCALVLSPGIGVSMLGRMTSRIDAPILPGETYVALGWPIESEGRKHLTGSAILSRDGELLACAKAVWIELRNG